MHGALEIGDGAEEISGLAAVLVEEGGDLGVGGGVEIPLGDDGLGVGHVLFDHRLGEESGRAMRRGRHGGSGKRGFGGVEEKVLHSPFFPAFGFLMRGFEQVVFCLFEKGTESRGCCCCYS